MEMLVGVVKGLWMVIEVVGGKNGISMMYVVIFLVNLILVWFQMFEVMFIGDGDEIVVVGCIKDGVFNVVVYCNLINGVFGKGVVGMYYFLGCVFLVVGVVMLFVVIGVVFFVVGLWMIWYVWYFLCVYVVVFVVQFVQFGVDVEFGGCMIQQLV